MSKVKKLSQLRAGPSEKTRKQHTHTHRQKRHEKNTCELVGQFKTFLGRKKLQIVVSLGNDLDFSP